MGWLKSCQIETVAMESTGVNWIPLFQNAVDGILKNIQSAKKSRVRWGNVHGVRFPWELALDFNATRGMSEVCHLA
jgi:hypothetical protein